MTGFPKPLKRAAQYLRMSTERQDYSLTYQADVIATYALAAEYEVVQTFKDEGISGVGIEKRAGLQALVKAVVGGEADFEVVLVYDVSRWGRFQNPDQAAHYEFLCAEAGVCIEYCAETFANDATPTAALLKHIKRAMAAEYSRELSEKVRKAQRGLKAEGFWMGASPAYGLRREAIGSDGSRLGLLNTGQYNPYPGAHTRLALGPQSEQDTVREAFLLYQKKGATFVSVARELNSQGRPSLDKGPWNSRRVAALLRNRIYVGDLVANQRYTQFGKIRVLPPEEWHVIADAAPAIVDRQTFDAVQKRRAARAAGASAEVVLKDLKAIFARVGRISHKVLLKHGRWSPRVYISRLGPINQMYALCGATPPPTHRTTNLAAARRALLTRGINKTEPQLLAHLQDLLDRAGYLSARMVDKDEQTPCVRTYQLRFGSLAAAYAAIGYEARSPHQRTAVRRILARSEDGATPPWRKWS